MDRVMHQLEGLREIERHQDPSQHSDKDELRALAARGMFRRQPSALELALARHVDGASDAQDDRSMPTPSDEKATTSGRESRTGPTPARSEVHTRFAGPPAAQESVLRRFLRRNDFLVKKRGRGARAEAAPKATAYLVDGWGGGVASVPDEYYAAFLDAYADDVDNGVPNYVSEQRSRAFRMHLDIDLAVPRTADRAAVLALVRLVQRVTALYYPASRASHRSLLAAIVLAAQEKPVDGGMAIKQGIHVVMPNLVVDSLRALDMREAYLLALKRVYGDDARPWAAGKRLDGGGARRHGASPHLSPSTPREEGGGTRVEIRPSDEAGDDVDPMVQDDDGERDVDDDDEDCDDDTMGGSSRPCPWDKVIDHQIYTQNGLRMAFSHAVVDCAVCQGKRPPKGGARTDCPGPCEGTGRCRERRWYEPVACLDGDGREDDDEFAMLSRNTHYCVKQTSIRRPADQQPTPGWCLYEGAPRCNVRDLDPAWYNRHVRGNNGEGAGNDAPSSSSAGGSSRRYLAPDDPRFARIRALMRVKALEVHRRADVESAFQDARGWYYIIEIGGEGARMCMNLKPPEGSSAPCGEHRTTRAYYQLSRHGLRHKCHCRCMDGTAQGRRYTRCSNFQSPLMPITRDDEVLLFGPPGRGSGGSNADRPAPTLFAGGAPIGQCAPGDALAKISGLMHALAQRRAPTPADPMPRLAGAVDGMVRSALPPSAIARGRLAPPAARAAPPLKRARTNP
jgi:hypothetical protein